MIDLHAHTTASDGSLSPRELVELAKKSGITALGITDHDTVDGIDEALRAGREEGLDIVPGLEFSAEYEPGTMHILLRDRRRALYSESAICSDTRDLTQRCSRRLAGVMIHFTL
jgi:predicted metal-dependent phosphoesterase TrpH